jgi:hypothetical protein
VFVLVACAIGSMFGPALSAGAIAELTHTPTVGPPGTVIDFDGTCTPGFNAEHVSVYMFLIVGQPGAPFDFWTERPVVDDAFAGSLTVPPDAPEGSYIISVACWNQDQTDGFTDLPFTVTGSDSSTTTADTTSTTLAATTTTTTTGAPPTTSQPPTIPPTPPPAPPVTGRPAYTG